MTEKLRQMERVKGFRVVRERLSEASVAAAATKLQAAARTLNASRNKELAGAHAAVREMEVGERAGQTMSIALRKAFGLDCERYEQVRAQCEDTMQQARETLRIRRIESEQVAVLHKNLREELQRQEERREQVEVVDRFLARSRWSSAKIRVRELTESA